MPTPPEVLFDRFFRHRSHLIKDGYRGKVDLDRLVGTIFPVSLLDDLQVMLNTALLHENKDIPGHVDHDPFHFDYLDSDEPNAVAFCTEGYSFIGITMPLVEQLWRAGTRLSVSRELQSLLRMQLTADQVAAMTASQRLEVLAFRLQLFFVVLHEFAHVVHGHVQRGQESAFSNEILIRGDGNIEQQARESDADGYAIYFLLANVFDGSQERAHLLGIAGQEHASQAAQDESLLSAFIMAAAAFMFIQPPQTLTEQDVRKRTHPLHAARLALMMKAANAWCLQNRPALAAWMTREQFQTVTRPVAAAIWGPEGSDKWSEQIAFLFSDAGKKYYDTLESEVVKLVLALGP
jgi:hypothetical protein